MVKDNKDEIKEEIKDEAKSEDQGKTTEAPKAGPAEKPEVDKVEEVEEKVEDIPNLSQMTGVEGTDPFVLISRDNNGLELKASQIGQKGAIVSYGNSICFAPGVIIQQAGENNCLA